MEQSNEGLLELNGIESFVLPNASLVLHFGLWPNPHAQNPPEEKQKLENKWITEEILLKRCYANYKRKKERVSK